ncbi:MAG: glycosyltransferase family 4 protein [Brevundimonas sp.]|uniref:glycosyltransferase family 4 protein n=1 Tax=Brevundimonas sp. TaxID=1871086 RepID=UPI003918CE44
MKVAVVLPIGARFSVTQPNSMETVVRTLAAADPTDLRIFCDEGAEDHGDLPVHPLPAQGRMGVLAKALRAFAPDIIECHQQSPQAVELSRRFPTTPVTLYRHNAAKAPRSPIDRWRHNRRYDQLAGLIFVSEASRRQFLIDFPRQAAKAYAITNPIDAALWTAAPEDRDPLIAFAGRAMPEKGVDLLCAALPLVLDRHPDWRAVLILNDWQAHAAWAAPHLTPLERFGGRVEVLRSAPLAEVQQWMKRAAIALTPSVWDEPLGLTALEAHAAGAALISSGRGGLREASGPHALYVDDLTPTALAEAMEALIQDPARRLALAKAAQAHVLSDHTPQRRLAELRALRSRLIGAS